MSKSTLPVWDEPEFRYAEFRADGDAMTGVVVRYGDEANLGEFREQFAPGSLRWDDVIVNLMHRRDNPVARTGAGLTLTETGGALEARVEPPESEYGKLALDLVRGRLLRGFSMEFRAVKEDWRGDLRVIREARLLGIGIVDRPAYSESEIAVRAAVNRPQPKPRRRRAL